MLAVEDLYLLHPDSVVKEGVPQGEVVGPFEFNDSKIYPNTKRKYWVYVPQQYDPSTPACLMVVNDGLGRAKGWRLPTVMDNLIADGSMPVTIGVFIDHGRYDPGIKGVQPRFNRSFEYDSVGDRYANFLLDELLPKVGQSYSISDDPNDHAIAGASSGAICAFNVAWERPDQFRRVLSTIGTYVGLRGANEFPTLIRKCEPKPLRVFLQDGSGDLDIYAGGWWTANQAMLSALNFAGYEVQHVWGTGGHNGKHGTAIMPDAMRWLWKDHGTEIKRGQFDNVRIPVLIPGEHWQIVDTSANVSKGKVSKANHFQASAKSALGIYVKQAGQRPRFAKSLAAFE
ncbi:MAG: alpha/beta hydrolase-fold protein, partial [Planctomycetota bacterium]